ncbi:MAG: energy-coupling factor transporter transmembrane protein EcfT [Peptococcaceae bacterium]|nr:energy-coupling factor transporter transmembrane protein EcfT [Peptococcaceae bacterium]
MFGGITLGQYVPGDSLLHRLDPRTKIMVVLAAAAAILSSAGWQGLTLATGFTLAALALSGMPARIFLRGMRSLWVLLAIAFIIQLLFTPGDVIAALGPLKISRQGLAGGSIIFLRLALLILIASLLTLTTPPIKLTAGLESMLSPLQRLGVPAHELALMMTIALRFIPTLLQEAEVVLKAQRARGAGFSGGKPAQWAKGLLPLFIPLFAGALRRADDLAVAMEARCYRGGANRTRMSSLKYRSADFIIIAVTLAVLAGTLAFRFM